MADTSWRYDPSPLTALDGAMKRGDPKPWPKAITVHPQVRRWLTSRIPRKDRAGFLDMLAVELRSNRFVPKGDVFIEWADGSITTERLVSYDHQAEKVSQ